MLFYTNINQHNKSNQGNVEMVTPTKTYSFETKHWRIEELVFPSPTFILLLKTKIIDIIQMPSPSLKKKYDWIVTDTPNTFKLKQNLTQNN